MKYLLVLAVGVVGGFTVAHLVNQTAAGREFFTGLDGHLKTFADAVGDGYRSRETELRRGGASDDTQKGLQA